MLHRRHRLRYLYSTSKYVDGFCSLVGCAPRRQVRTCGGWEGESYAIVGPRCAQTGPSLHHTLVHRLVEETLDERHLQARHRQHRQTLNE